MVSLVSLEFATTTDRDNCLAAAQSAVADAYAALGYTIDNSTGIKRIVAKGKNGSDIPGAFLSAWDTGRTISGIPFFISPENVAGLGNIPNLLAQSYSFTKHLYGPLAGLRKENTVLALDGSNATLPRLHTAGNKIKNTAGNDVHLHGVAIADLTPDYSGVNAQDRITSLNTYGWTGVNFIRLCCPLDHIAKYGIDSYMEFAIDPAVKKCEQMGLYCIIDWHQGDVYTNPAVDTALRAFWSAVAPRYKDLPHVMYEIYNEPHGANWTGAGGLQPYMQTWANFVRGYAPNTVLFIGTPTWCQLVAQVVGNELTGGNFVYVGHFYPAHMPGGSDKNYNLQPVATTDLATKQAWMDSAFVNAANSFPVAITEFGYTLEGSQSTIGGDYLWRSNDRSKFITPFLDYLDAHPHIAWTCYTYENASAPQMLSSSSGGTYDFGTYLKARFASYS